MGEPVQPLRRNQYPAGRRRGGGGPDRRPDDCGLPDGQRLPGAVEQVPHAAPHHLRHHHGVLRGLLRRGEQPRWEAAGELERHHHEVRGGHYDHRPPGPGRVLRQPHRGVRPPAPQRLRPVHGGLLSPVPAVCGDLLPPVRPLCRGEARSQPDAEVHLHPRRHGLRHPELRRHPAGKQGGL